MSSGGGGWPVDLPGVEDLTIEEHPDEDGRLTAELAEVRKALVERTRSQLAEASYPCDCDHLRQTVQVDVQYEALTDEMLKLESQLVGSSRDRRADLMEILEPLWDKSSIFDEAYGALDAAVAACTECSGCRFVHAVVHRGMNITWLRAASIVTTVSDEK